MFKKLFILIIVVLFLNWTKNALSYYLTPINDHDLATLTACEKQSLNYHNSSRSFNSVSQYEYQLAHNNCKK
jgi:hypothetical protein